MATVPFDLRARAHRAMLEAGFCPDFPPDVLQEAQAANGLGGDSNSGSIKDLRDLAWSSIDNDSSRDLDQIEYAERLGDGSYRLLVGIADVDGRVPRGSATDRHAASETVSVYTGVSTFPMLPAQLSTSATSLLGDADRFSVVMELHMTAAGAMSGHEVYPALVRNRAKLAYSSTGAWLEGRGPMPAPVAAVPAMEDQLRLQLELAKLLRQIRSQQGALNLGMIEVVPVATDGQGAELVVHQHTVAEEIIENFMVTANVAMAEHLKQRNIPSIRRVVRTPRRWDRIQ